MQSAGESALRAQTEPIKPDISRRVIDPLHKSTLRREVTRRLVIVLQQIRVDVQFVEELPGGRSRLPT